jgi:hypothetical protein
MLAVSKVLLIILILLMVWSAIVRQQDFAQMPEINISLPRK